MEQDKIENKKERLSRWLKDSDNLMLVGVLIIALVLRLYYFMLTKSQPLWWDEAVYGSLAKNILYHTWDGTPHFIVKESIIRPPLFYLVWSILIKIGIKETGTRFLLEFIPSILSVFFIYLSIKEISNKRSALMATFIFSFLWIHLFYTGRLLTSVPSLPFVFLSIYFFIRATHKNFIAKKFFISLFLLSIATLIRYPNGLIFFAYLFFLILTLRLDLLKNRSFWVSGITSLIPLWIFFIISYITKGSIFPALNGDYASVGTIRPIAYNTLSFVQVYLQKPLFYVFLLGFAISLYSLALRFDLIRKSKKLSGSLLLTLILVLFNTYFIFYIRAIEDRWLFPTSICLVYFTATGLTNINNFLKKYHKQLGTILILLLLFFGAYAQIKVADPLIKNKMQSFLQIRQGFEWIGKNTPESSVILGKAIAPYAAFYADRKYIDLPVNESEITEATSSADYLVVHAFRPQPEYLNNYLQQNQAIWQPIQIFYFDQQNTQVALVIYKKV